VLGRRFEQPGIVEGAGAVELQHDGFRAERARPYALVVTPGRNADGAERLARRYQAEVVRVPDADALLAWCAERGLGLDAATVVDLLGPENEEERLRSERRKRRGNVLRIATVVAIAAAVIAAGWAFESGPPANHRVCGRAGCFKVDCPKPAAPGTSAGRQPTQPARLPKGC
jgi:hypothetical protein